MSELSEKLGEQAGRWQPIKTAPKDGSVILLYCPDAREPSVILGEWSEFESALQPGKVVIAEWTDTWAERELDCEPTHWQPLPEPPGKTG